MMGGNDLRDLYQEVIFDHNRNPRNFYAMEHANRSADGHNPLCGDQLTVYLHVVDDVIQDVSFIGHGCAISTASASIMTEDRKSTRLNSSHVAISYAVFCLNKNRTPTKR